MMQPVSKSDTTAVILKIFLTSLAFFGVWSLCLPLYIDILVFLFVSWVAVISRKDHLAILCVSFYFSLALLQFLCGSILAGMSDFYREHEKYAVTGQLHYKPMVTDTINQPFGDLSSIDPGTPVQMRQPRLVHFKTDQLGFRNNKDYSGQKLILVGDSFVTCNGVDQHGMLSEVLWRRYRLPVYNIAYPAGPDEYLEMCRQFLDQKDSSAKFAFFIFEGNDFLHPDFDLKSLSPRVILPRLLARILNRYDSVRNKLLRYFGSFLGYSKITGGMARRIERLLFIRDITASVLVYPVGNQPMGFYVLHVASTLSEKTDLMMPYLPRVTERIACVFFIPEKARVYKDCLPESIRRRMIEPSPAFVYLKKQMSDWGIPVIDLTPVLTQRAKDLLPKGRTVFWRDDTHWNEDGIASVAPVIARALRRIT